MSKIWFVYNNDIVSGPFTTEQVQSQLASGQWNTNCFIWWKGQREWTPVRVWESQLSRILKSEEDKVQNPVWYVDLGGSPVGPLTQKEMLANLRSLNNLGRVRLWTVGMNKWTNLFELHDVMEQLGLSRRENDRAPLMGAIAVNRPGDESRALMTKAASISIAGVGLNEAQGLIKGEEVGLLIKSQEFPAPLRLRGTVVYVTPQGYAGLRFVTVHPETQSLIFDYVKKFMAPQTQAKSA